MPLSLLCLLMTADGAAHGLLLQAQQCFHSIHCVVCSGILTDIFYMISARPLVWFKEPTDGGWIKILEVDLSVGEAFDLANKNVQYGKPENIL